MAGRCSICGFLKTVHRSRITKELVCLVCHHKEFYKPNIARCSFCQEVRPVHFRYAGLIGCEDCYYRKFYKKTFNSFPIAAHGWQ